MDNAVSLVRAYLQLHGYFVVTEYPLVGLNEEKKMRMVTDTIFYLRCTHMGRIVSSFESRHD